MELYEGKTTLLSVGINISTKRLKLALTSLIHTQILIELNFIERSVVESCSYCGPKRGIEIN